MAVVLTIGCAETYPLVKEAKAEYDVAVRDAALKEQAPDQLKEAKEEFRMIENLKKKGASDQLINHHAYLAKQKVAIAHEMARLNTIEDEIGSAEREQALVMNEVQAAEARFAEREAEHARQRAEEARRRSQMLADRINELEAQQTERGIVLTLSNVQFDFGKATLRTGSEQNLAKLTRFLIEYPDRTVLIEGFTDSIGSEEANANLSLRRAEAVKQALINNGIDSDRLMTRGYGEKYAIADNNTNVGRQQNRRVEIVISDDRGIVTERRVQ
jgi:outer membrane protein OmpA-like peptidoglycan-associated protein